MPAFIRRAGLLLLLVMIATSTGCDPGRRVKRSPFQAARGPTVAAVAVRELVYRTMGEDPDLKTRIVELSRAWAKSEKAGPEDLREIAREYIAEAGLDPEERRILVDLSERVLDRYDDVFQALQRDIDENEWRKVIQAIALAMEESATTLSASVEKVYLVGTLSGMIAIE